MTNQVMSAVLTQIKTAVRALCMQNKRKSGDCIQNTLSRGTQKYQLVCFTSPGSSWIQWHPRTHRTTRITSTYAVFAVICFSVKYVLAFRNKVQRIYDLLHLVAHMLYIVIHIQDIEHSTNSNYFFKWSVQVKSIQYVT